MAKQNQIRKEIPVALTNATMTQITNEGGGGRKYEVDDLLLPSVTTVLSNLRNYGLDYWRNAWLEDRLDAYQGQTLTPAVAEDIKSASSLEASHSASIGVAMHEIIDQLLRGEAKITYPDQLEPAIRAWLKWRKQFQHLEFLGSETGVYLAGTITAHYAGQVDAIFRDPKKGNLIVVDWKTSGDGSGGRSGIYDDNLLQLGAYTDALHYMQGKDQRPLQVEGMVVRLCNDYPREGKKKIRWPQAEKVFSGNVEYAYLDSGMCNYWGDLFSQLKTVIDGRKLKVVKATI